jgi:hypothetical protein
MAKISIGSIEKGIEVAAEDVLKFISGAQTKAPAAVAALGVLAGGIETALTAVGNTAANPTTLVLNLPTDIADIKSVWPEVKTFLGTLGIKL